MLSEIRDRDRGCMPEADLLRAWSWRACPCLLSFWPRALRRGVLLGGALLLPGPDDVLLRQQLRHERDYLRRYYRCWTECSSALVHRTAHPYRSSAPMSAGRMSGPTFFLHERLSMMSREGRIPGGRLRSIPSFRLAPAGGLDLRRLPLLGARRRRGSTCGAGHNREASGP